MIVMGCIKRIESSMHPTLITYSNSESSESDANSEKCEKHEKSVLSSQSRSLSAKSMADLAFAQSANPHC